MQRDGQHILVRPPQFLEQHLGLAARVDEQQRRAVLPDLVVDLGNGVARRMPGPRHMLLRFQDGDVGPGPARHGDETGHPAGGILRHQPAPQLVRLGHGGRQADGAQVRHEAAQPRQAQRQQVAALGGDQRMQFVEDHVAQILEEPPGIRAGDQQRQLLRRGQQYVRRRQLLALALVGGRVAGAGLDGDGQADLGHRLAEVALDVHGQRLQRRDVERGDAAPRLSGLALRPLRQLRQRGQEAGQRLAGAGGRDQQRRLPGLRPRQKLDLVGTRRPAFLPEPFQEGFGQKCGGIGLGGIGLADRAGLRCHAPEVARTRRIAKRNMEQKGIVTAPPPR